MMETVLEATVRLRMAGYDVDYSATEDGHLRCGQCGADLDPVSMVIDEVVRYEGASNPDDQTILLALSCGCDHPGVYSAGFGPNASTADVAVLRRLP